MLRPSRRPTARWKLWPAASGGSLVGSSAGQVEFLAAVEALPVIEALGRRPTDVVVAPAARTGDADALEIFGGLSGRRVASRVVHRVSLYTRIIRKRRSRRRAAPPGGPRTPS